MIRSTTGKLAALACAAALGAAGCGSDDKNEGPGVPQEAVAEINTQLDSLAERVDVRIGGACEDAQDENIPAIQRQVDGLPSDTDPEVKKALSESVANLSSLLDTECQDIDEQETREREQTDTATTPTETEIQTETVPETTPETTPQTTPTTPDDGGDDGNNGNGNGNDSDGDGNGNGGSSPDDSGGVLSP